MILQTRQRKILYGITIVFLLVLAIRNVSHFTPYLTQEKFTRRTDFPNYYMGAVLLRDRSQNIYDLQTQETYYRNITGIDINKYHEYTNYVHVGKVSTFFLPFRALPPLALVLLPLAYLPYGQAYSAFLIVNICILFSALYLLTYKTHTTQQQLLVFLGAIAYEATFLALGQGQPTILLLLVAVLVYLYLQEKQLFYAGLLSGLFLLKTQYIVITPLIWIVTKLDKKYLLGLLLSVTLFAALSLLLVGPEVLMQYPKFVAYTENETYFSPPKGLVSVQSYLTNLFRLDTISHKVIVISMGMYAVIATVIAKNVKKYSLEYLFSMSILFGLLFSLHLFGQDLVVIYVVIVLLAKHIQKTQSTNLILYLCLLSMLIAPHIKVYMLTAILYIIPGIVLLTFPQLVHHDQFKS